MHTQYNLKQSCLTCYYVSGTVLGTVLDTLFRNEAPRSTMHEMFLCMLYTKFVIVKH